MEELLGQFKAVNDELQAAALAANADDATPEAIEKYNDVAARAADVQKEIEVQRNKHETAAHRVDREKYARQMAEYRERFELDTIQAPNYNRAAAKQARSYAANPDNLQRDISVAAAAWSHGGTPENLTQEEVDACKRAGINPANPTLNLRATIGKQGVAAMLGAFRHAGSKANFTSEMYEAVADYFDSREDSTLGLTNRAPGFINDIARKMVSYGGILNAPVTVTTTADFEDLIETWTDDAQRKGRQLGEGASIGTKTVATSHRIVWKSFDYTSDSYVVTNRQLERTRLNFPTFVSDNLGERLGRIMSEHLNSGNAATQPEGLLTAVVNGGKQVLSGTADQIVVDDIRKLVYTVDEMFADGPSVGFMMNRRTMLYLMQLKDSELRPYFNFGVEENGRSRTLDGYPVYSNYEMVAYAGGESTGQRPIIFGDFSKFVVRYCGSAVPVLIRDDTTFRDELKTKFTALVNFDSRLRDYGNCPLSYLQIS